MPAQIICPPPKSSTVKPNHVDNFKASAPARGKAPGGGVDKPVQGMWNCGFWTPRQTPIPHHLVVKNFSDTRCSINTRFEI